MTLTRCSANPTSTSTAHTMANSKQLPPRLVGIGMKMYFDYPTTSSYITSLKTQYPSPPHPSVGLFVIPDLLSVAAASYTLLSTPHILLGAQDCCWEDSGPYTGEISPLALKQTGCSIVELGHAERRTAPFNETEEMIAKKAAAAVRNGLIPLVCIGEKAKSGIMSEGVGIALRECTPQAISILDVIPESADVILAYEPVWAIGVQEPASADHVLAVVGSLREMIAKRKRSGQLRILYGGSAGPGTWGKLKGGVDGLFLGRFAHDLEALKKVVDEVVKE